MVGCGRWTTIVVAAWLAFFVGGSQAQVPGAREAERDSINLERSRLFELMKRDGASQQVKDGYADLAVRTITYRDNWFPQLDKLPYLQLTFRAAEWNERAGKLRNAWEGYLEAVRHSMVKDPRALSLDDQPMYENARVKLRTLPCVQEGRASIPFSSGSSSIGERGID